MEINECYTIAHYDLGIAVRGNIPDFMQGIFAHLFYTHFGYDVTDIDIAEKLNCDIIFTSISKAQKWRIQLGIDKEGLQ